MLGAPSTAHAATETKGTLRTEGLSGAMFTFFFFVAPLLLVIKG